MKKNMLTMVAITLFAGSTAVFAQTGTAKSVASISNKKQSRAAAKTEIRSTTLQQFKIDFPGATIVKRTTVSNMDKITFTLKGIQASAYYDSNSSLVGTVSSSTRASLPAGAIQFIDKHYQGYIIGTVLFYDDNESNSTDMMLYGEQFADADYYFVEVEKKGKKIIVQVSAQGDVFFFQPA